MNKNPYEPTKTELVDPPSVLPPRPRAVNIALGLLVTVVVLHILAPIYLLQEAQFRIGSYWAWVVRGFNLLLILGLAHQVTRRRHWARVVLAILALIGFAQLCYGFGSARKYLSTDEILELLPRFFVMQVLPVAMSLAAIHLLFFSSGDWFRRHDAG